jgi:hypothetical protein
MHSGEGLDGGIETARERPALQTDIPARLDRLPWSRFHAFVVVALGVTWILDGLEVTIVGAIGPTLQSAQTLALTAQRHGTSASAYVFGAVAGALVFGWLTDRFGLEFLSFAAFRAVTGIGIGGEYVAIRRGSRNKSDAPEPAAAPTQKLPLTMRSTRPR